MKRYRIEAYSKSIGDHHGGQWEYAGESNRSIVALMRMAGSQTARSGIGYRIVFGRTGRVLATYKRGDEGETIVITPARVSDVLMRLRRDGESEEKDEAIEELTSANRGLASTVTGYRKVESDIAESRRWALEDYRRYRGNTGRLHSWVGNVPHIYRCLHCHLYFAINGTRARVVCRYCDSEKVRLWK